jgi:hypothetical protein
VLVGPKDGVNKAYNSLYFVAYGRKPATLGAIGLNSRPVKKRTMKLTTAAMIAIVPLLGFVSSCEKKGPAEKAGEKLDEAIEDVKDTVDPKGPVEKAGEKVDEALDN